MKENILAQQELLKSNIATLYGINRNTIEKSGEGSKGGNVIGHTKSGKPIYATKNAKDYKDFTKEDHADARVAHLSESNKHKKEADIHDTRHVKFLQNNDEDTYGHDLDRDNSKRQSRSHALLADSHTEEYSKFKDEKKPINISSNKNSSAAMNHSNPLQKSEENTIEKGQTSDAFRYSDSSAFKIDLTGAEIKEKCKTAIPYLIAQKNALKEIAQDALNQCEGILPDDTRKDNNISYAVFSYDLREPKRDQYSNTYPEESDCQKQMGRYNSAIYQMLDINSDIKVLQTLANTLTDNKTYSLTLNQIVAISMGYTEDELAEKAIEVEIEKGGEGSKGGNVIGHTKSGKPVYGPTINYHNLHQNFTKEDHEDAEKTHLYLSNKLHKKAQDYEDKGDDKNADKLSKKASQHSSLMDYHRTEKFRFNDKIEKGGEGSRGGKIIGHTKSGKPIYANKSANHKDYKDFDEQDHKDAIKLHDNLSGEYDIKNTKSISSKDKAEFIKNRDNHADKVESHIKKTGKKYGELFKN